MANRYVNPEQQIADPDTQLNFQAVEKSLNELLQFVYWGSGAPALTPPGRAIYIRTDGGAATTLYVYEGAGWVGK